MDTFCSINNMDFPIVLTLLPLICGQLPTVDKMAGLNISVIQEVPLHIYVLYSGMYIHNIVNGHTKHCTHSSTL